jgi:hypothetical protein
LFEHSALLLGGKDLSVAVAGTLQLDVDETAVANAANVVDTIVVASVECVSDAQNGSQCVHGFSVGLV